MHNTYRHRCHDWLLQPGPSYSFKSAVNGNGQYDVSTRFQHRTHTGICSRHNMTYDKNDDDDDWKTFGVNITSNRWRDLSIKSADTQHNYHHRLLITTSTVSTSSVTVLLSQKTIRNKSTATTAAQQWNRTMQKTQLLVVVHANRGAVISALVTLGFDIKP